jgi:hypothetical protein
LSCLTSTFGNCTGTTPCSCVVVIN